MEETDRHDAVVWAELLPAEIAFLATKGIDREFYKDMSYEDRQEFFDRRNK